MEYSLVSFSFVTYLGTFFSFNLYLSSYIYFHLLLFFLAINTMDICIVTLTDPEGERLRSNGHLLKYQILRLTRYPGTIQQAILVTQAFLTLIRGHSRTARSNVTDIEVSALSAYFLFFILFIRCSRTVKGTSSS